MKFLSVSGTKRQGMGGECIMASFVIALLTKCHSSDKIQKKEMGLACSPHGKERRVAYKVMVGRHEGKRLFG
jgi:hypothetical protein